MMKWYNVELDEDNALKLREYLYDLGVKFETSACGIWSIHFEIYLEPDSGTHKKVCEFIEKL